MQLTTFIFDELYRLISLATRIHLAELSFDIAQNCTTDGQPLGGAMVAYGSLGFLLLFICTIKYR